MIDIKVDINKLLDQIVKGIIAPVKFIEKLYTQNNSNKVNTKNISEIEKNIIMKFYDSNLNEFVTTPVTIAENDETFSVLCKLVDRNILEYKSDIQRIMLYDGFGVPYKMSKPATIKLNKIYKIQKSI